MSLILRKLTVTALAFAGALTAQSVFALTASGTDVTNSAAVNYQVGGVSQPQVTSNTDTFKVDTKVDLDVSIATTTNVVPNAQDQVLTFVVTNEGNATQGIALDVAASGGDDFDMSNVQLFIDEGNGVFDGTESLYTSGSGANAGDLTGDLGSGGGTLTVFVVADTPVGATDGQSSDYILTATALVASSTTVQAESGADTDGGVEAVYADAAGSTDAIEDGTHSATGTYAVVSAVLSVTKSSVVADDGLTASSGYAIPGATITYSILVDNTAGSADATSVSVADTIDAATTYVASSVDVAISAGGTDTDITDGASGANTGALVTVSGGGTTITVSGFTVPAGQTATVTFDVTIN